MLKLAPGTIEVVRDGRNHTTVAITPKSPKAVATVVGWRPWVRWDKPDGSNHYYDAAGNPLTCRVSIPRHELARMICKGRRLGYACRVVHL